MIISERTSIGQVLNAARATGIKVPGAVTAASERSDRLTAVANRFGHRGDVLHVAVAAAVDNGRDPASDPDVQRLLAETALSNDGVRRGVDALGIAGVAAALTEHADAIIGTWREVFDQAAATLVSAHRQLGDVTLDDTGAVLAQGPVAATVWAEARNAVATIHAVREGWYGLATLARVPLNPQRAVLRIAAVAPDTWSDLRERGADPWVAIGSGLTLGLPTLGEYLARNRVIDEHLAQTVTAVNTERSGIAGREIREAVVR